MKLSAEQEQIVSYAAREHEKHMAIMAYAGSGKTSTLVQIARAKPKNKKIVAVAFAKPNALDFERVMPFNVESGTMHSFGLKASVSRLGQIQVQTNKIYKIADSMGLKLTKQFPTLPRIIGFAKAQGIVCYDTLGKDFVCSQQSIHSYFEDSDENWKAIFDRLSVVSDFDDIEMIELCRKFMAVSTKLALPGAGKKPMFDFDDMIYIPACFSNGEGLPSPDVLLVDEGQDLNFTQHAIIHFIISNSKAQAIIVGDPNQAIYAFRGADEQSFDSLINQFDCEIFELSHTFRSDKSITKCATQFVPDMKTFCTEAGEVNELSFWHPKDVKAGDAVICRNTAPLVSVFYKFLKHGLPAKIKGSEIGKGLISILKSKIRGDSVTQISDSIDGWYIQEENKARERGYEHRVGILLEQSSILKMVLQFEVRENKRKYDIRQYMIKRLESMFTDDVPKICLATIHKAKGLEWDRVWLLDSWLMPSKWAKKPWELQQEDNLHYVAITRAKHVLNYVNSKNIQDN